MLVLSSCERGLDFAETLLCSKYFYVSYTAKRVSWLAKPCIPYVMVDDVVLYPTEGQFKATFACYKREGDHYGEHEERRLTRVGCDLKAN